MFFLPVPLEDGWAILMWDMMSRKPHILDLDPMIRGNGPTEPTKDKLELIAWKLHHALFHCLKEYYAGWPTQDGEWDTHYLLVADEIFVRDDTGECVLHIARHYDGTKLKIPLTKHNVGKTERQALHEGLKLQGNASKLAHEALWSVLALTDSWFGSNQSG